MVLFMREFSFLSKPIQKGESVKKNQEFVFENGNFILLKNASLKSSFNYDNCFLYQYIPMTDMTVILIRIILTKDLLYRYAHVV